MGNDAKRCEDSLRVLIVDDLVEVRISLAAVLSLAGRSRHPRIEIAGEVGSGRAALDQFRGLQPDVVLMDLEMPDIDGYVATRGLKRIDPSLWVIALTIHNSPEDRRKAQLSGVDVFIEKGAPLEDLIAAIQRCGK